MNQLSLFDKPPSDPVQWLKEHDGNFDAEQIADGCHLSLWRCVAILTIAQLKGEVQETGLNIFQANQQREG